MDRDGDGSIDYAEASALFTQIHGPADGEGVTEGFFGEVDSDRGS
jgi:hypothetical protein